MENINIEELNKQLADVIDTNNERNSKYSEWLKNIITIAVGFIAIIVSLKTKKSVSVIEHYSYLAMLCSNVLGIICGLIVLYSDVKVLNLAVNEKKLAILRRLNETNVSPFPEINFVKRPVIYLYISYLCYISFIMSLISLICYSFVID